MSDDNVFPKKWEKYLPTGFEDTVNTMDDTEMESNIITCEKTISATEKEMDNDPKLNGAKDLVKDFSMAYKDVINTQKAKIKYIIYTMEQRGKGP
jgi:hypothetical protein